MTRRWREIVHPGRRTLAGLLLAAAAGSLVLVLTRPQPSQPVLVAAGPLPAGVPLETLELAVRRLPDATGLVVGNGPADLEGWTLAAPLAEGEPLPASLLRAPQRTAYPGVLAISVDSSHAVLGQLQTGDSIDVYVTVDGGGGPMTTSRVASDVFVVSAALGSDGIGGDDRVNLLVAVDEDLAPRLASAMASGDLDLVKVSP